MLPWAACLYIQVTKTRALNKDTNLRGMNYLLNAHTVQL